ncbi:MAG: S53 family peptidase [Candidatus Bathyarchaeota archaeon]|nr:S53 family peptidase [Candidatus Bathyarchaeota archaeon]
MTRIVAVFLAVLMACSILSGGGLLHSEAWATTQQTETEWTANPFFEATPAASYYTAGYSPSQIRAAYNLPSNGGANTTIAIVNAFDAPTVTSDLSVFCSQFGLPQPTESNFEIHKMSPTLASDSRWASETALDVEWAHAIAPEAKILLVLAVSSQHSDLLDAVDYATSRPDVVAVSMSWGGPEDSKQTSWDNHLTSAYGAVFFAASGDNASDYVSWPASSTNVVAVGGTTLKLYRNGTVISETAWSKSGGGISAYETKPAYQTAYGLSGSKRQIPDVSYNANPYTGFAVYYESSWYRIGGTSAGAPQWAAIQALNRSATNVHFYARAKSPSNSTYFRDILSGSNGYPAQSGYDLVTGLGSPLTINFKSEHITEDSSVTLIAAGQSKSLNATNQFKAHYFYDGTLHTEFLSNGTTHFTIDKNTFITVAGESSASSTQEKWVLNAAGNSVSGNNLTLYYYDLLSQTVSFFVLGGGDPPNPTLTYVTASATASVQPTTQVATLNLTQTPQVVYAQKGTSLSVTGTLSASSTERWVPPFSLVVVQNVSSSRFIYQHQVLLEVLGLQVTKEWFTSGETANIDVQGVFARSGGTGKRVTAYTVDNNEPVQVQPTSGAVTLSVVMDVPHRVTVQMKTQYQVNLDASALSQLSSITAPTLMGDDYWYDEGTQVKVTFNGIGSRSGGSGQRVFAYTVNGQTTQVATTDAIVSFDVPLFSTQTVSVTLTDQHQLTLESGVLRSMTKPSIAGDSGWYDAGTAVIVTFDYSWTIASNQLRVNAVGYTTNGTYTALPRAANGTFSVQITLTQPDTIAVSSVTQYCLNVEGGNNVAFSEASPTDDGFFDEGAEVTVTTDNVWNSMDGARHSLSSYLLDGSEATVSSVDAENVTVVLLKVDCVHQLRFNFVVQYLVSFQFTDYSETKVILPSSFKIETDGNPGSIIDAPQFHLWLSNGTRFWIHSIIWHDMDVQPSPSLIYEVVNAGANETVHCLIYDAKISVKDYLNLPVSDAAVTVTFANQTTIQKSTSSDGTINLLMIPHGTFNATVSYLGSSTTVTGDASQPTITTKLFSSIPTLSLVAVAAILALVTGVLLVRRRRE